MADCQIVYVLNYYRIGTRYMTKIFVTVPVIFYLYHDVPATAVEVICLAYDVHV